MAPRGSSNAGQLLGAGTGHRHQGGALGVECAVGSLRHNPRNLLDPDQVDCTMGLHCDGNNGERAFAELSR